MKKLFSVLIPALLLAGIGVGAYFAFFYHPAEKSPNPTVEIVLSDGSTLRAELYPDLAPNTVANFVNLAQSGFYDGLEVYRVVPGVLIQTGDPNGDGTGGAGYTIKGEFRANGVRNDLAHTRGVLSMARQSGFDTASSQFFILEGSYPQYDGQYAAFGMLTDEESLAALDKIASQPVDSFYVPLSRVYIKSVTVETYGAEYHVIKNEQEETT
ncbi:MAG: peptidylprolyl isomerase [Eubacteriales bacterium]|nr:peptidylprolyl isomerase [Eubacteriales bacterium]